MTYENILYRLDQGIDNYGTGLSTPVDPSFLYETEEDRRKRLERERQQTVSTQTVETAADGTQTVTTKQVAQPVSPETYNRMIQAESGGRNFTPQGQPLTSPKGAMFAAQVMPATAAQPGFGVRPAQAQTPEEYNRVGQEYYQALLNKYNGNEQLAAAAYNMGPGAVDKNIQRNQGQFNVAQAPQETQGYLNKVFQGVGRAVEGMIPSAQAATLPQPQAGAGRGTMGMPQVFPEEGVAVATGRGVQGTMETPAQRQMAIVTGQNVATTSSQPYIDMYQRDQNDPIQMLALRGDTSAPEFIRKRAGERAYELMDQEYKKAQAEKQAKELVLAAGQGDRKASNTIARELQSEEGSWLKFLFLGFINKELAGMELVKLGFGNVDRAVQDANGKSYMVTYNAMGTPLRGFSADGKDLTQEELISVAAGGGKRNLDIVGGTYVNDTTGEVGRVVTDKNTGRSYIQTDTGMKPMTGFRPQSSQGTLADMRTRAIQDLNIKLQGKGVEEQMQILRPYNQMLVQNGFQPVQPAEVGIRVPQVSGGAAAQAAPTTAVAPEATTTAQQQPVTAVAPTAVQQPAPTIAAPAGAGMGGRPTATQIEANKTKAKEEAEIAGKDIGTIRANQGKAEANADYLITKVDQLLTHPGFEVSVGSQLGPSMGFGLFKEPVRGTDAAGWFARFKEVQGQSFLQAIENLRGMGALSNLEGETATKAIQRMNISQSEDEFKAAAKDFQEIIQRGIDRNRVKLGQEPKYGTKPASEMAAETPTKKLSREEQQAVEWVRKNPNDPRAAEIKNRLGL